jgi:hypothetical protein
MTRQLSVHGHAMQRRQDLLVCEIARRSVEDERIRRDRNHYATLSFLTWSKLFLSRRSVVMAVRVNKSPLDYPFRVRANPPGFFLANVVY